MIGLDTNVLVRYLTQDDTAQALKASRVIETSEAASLFISSIVLCDLVWVLEDSYGSSRTDIADTLDRILRTGQFAFEDKDLLWRSLDDYQRGKGDFSDHLVGRVGLRAGCNHTYSFDKELKNNRLFRLL